MAAPATPLKPSFSLKNQIQPRSQPDTRLRNANLNNGLRSLKIRSTDFGTIVNISALDHSIIADLPIAFIRPFSGGFFLLVLIGNRKMFQPTGHEASVLAAVHLGRKGVCPALRVCGDVDLCGWGESQDPVGNAGVPGRVQIRLVPVEIHRDVVCTLAKGLRM
jgi:hypothetical protein